MGLKVENLLPPIEPIDLPGGRSDLPVCDFTFRMQKLYERAEQGDEVAERELLHECVPSITDEEIDTLGPGEKLWIIYHCARRLHEVTEHLKNVGGAVVAPATAPPSTPTTNTSTPSPASPVRSGATGSRKRNSRSTAPSTPLTA